MRDRSHPEIHLSRSATNDVAARFLNLCESAMYDVNRDPCHICTLSVPNHQYIPTQQEIADLRFLGVAVDAYSVAAFSVCHVMGVHFRSGEWGCHPRCGSVVTCVVNGRSLYARVHRFLRVDGDSSPGYASVSWFSAPQYPFDIPLVVVVDEQGDELDAQLHSIIRITSIDPSPIVVEPARECESRYYMMRETGYDTIP